MNRFKNELYLILKDRLEIMEVKGVQDDAIYMIALNTDRPGMVLVACYEFIKWCKENDKEMNALAFTVYSSKTLGKKDPSEYYKPIWYAQKDDKGNNKIDTKEYWDLLK